MSDTKGRPQENVDSELGKFWKLYKSQADKHDTTLTTAWKDETGTILIFTGLFSSVVSAFITQTYQMLLPDNSGTTVALLTQLVVQSQSNGSTAGIPPVALPTGAQGGFKPSGIAIRINILMFLSLFLSLTCALLSTLVLRWAREYLQYSQLSDSPQQCGRVRAYLFEGVTKFNMRYIVEGILVLLHASFFFFFFAASEFLRTVNDTVGLAAKYCAYALLSAYCICSLFPLIVNNSPYHTALTALLRYHTVLTAQLRWSLVDAKKATPPGPDPPMQPPARLYSRSQHLISDANQRASYLDRLALKWLLENADEAGMGKFVTGLPGLVQSPFFRSSDIAKRPLGKMLERVMEHFMSCMLSHELSPATQMTRAFTSLKAINAIFSTSHRLTAKPSDEKRCESLTRNLIEISASFCTGKDSTLVLSTASTRARTFHTLIGSLSASAKAQSPKLPPHLLSLAQHLQALAKFHSQRWRNEADLEEETLVVSKEPSHRKLHSTMLSDGELINFLVLIKDILPYLQRPTLELIPVWDTLEMIIGAFHITQPTTHVYSWFKEVLDDVHGCYVLEKGLRGDALDSSMPIPSAERLWEFMSKVDKGLRLVAVLSPKPSLPLPGAVTPTGAPPPRQDHIFTMNPFSFFDVLEAFSSVLEGFIRSVNPAEARETVENMITSDNLLSCISVHLNTSVTLGVLGVEQENMSIVCLDVLKIVFGLLGGSSILHWYKFGLDEVLISVNNIAHSPEMVSDPSKIHVYCTLGIINHVIIDQLRSQIDQGQLPSLKDPEKRSIRQVYNCLHLFDEQGQDRHQEDPNTSTELSSQCLRSLLVNGPLQNFLIMAVRMVPHLKRKETIPEIVWKILRKLVSNVPDLAYADDRVILGGFSELRSDMYKVIMEEEDKEEGQSQEQRRLLELIDTVAEGLGLELPVLSLPRSPSGTYLSPSEGDLSNRPDGS